MHFTNKTLPQMAVRSAKELSPGVDDTSATGYAFTATEVDPNSAMTPKDARRWVESNPWIYSCVRRRCFIAANSDWTVDVIDRKKPYNQDTIDRINAFFAAPDPTFTNSTFQTMVASFTHDIEVLDKGCIIVQRYPGQKDPKTGVESMGEPFAARAIDGGLVNFAKAKWKSPADGYRYLYREQGQLEPTKLESSELILIKANPVTYQLNGLAPIKVLRRIILAEWDAFRSSHVVQKNRTTSGFVKMPGASPAAIDAAKELFLEELAGQSGIGWMSIPADSDFVELGSIDLEKQGTFWFYDLLVKAIASSFRTTTTALNWTEDVNKAVATEQSRILDEGDMALLELIQSYFNLELVKTFEDSENIGFFYTSLMTKDQALAPSAIRDMSGRNSNWSTINDQRQRQGLTKLEVDDPREQLFYDRPLIQVANGQMAPAAIALLLPQYQPAPIQAELGSGSNERTTPQALADTEPVAVAASSSANGRGDRRLPPARSHHGD